MTSNAAQGNPPPADGSARQESVLEVGTQRVARVYAEALFRAAEKSNQAQAILEELQTLIDKVLNTQPEVEAFLSSGAINRKRKAEAVRSIFDNRASELFVNFLSVLTEHDRLDALRPVVSEYRELLNERAGRMRVKVQSAVPLPDDQKERLREQLRSTYHKEPLLETEVVPDLLGGIVVRVGDWLFDESVRSRLEDIRNQIIARSSYEIQSGRNRFSA